MNKIWIWKVHVILVIIILLIHSVAFAVEQTYPLYANSLPPLRLMNFPEWGGGGDQVTGIVVEALKGTVAIECLLKNPGTKVTAYKIRTKNDEIVSKTKIGEAVSEELSWTRIEIPKLTKNTKIYLNIDFSESIGYSPGLVADLPVWDSEKMQLVINNRYLSPLGWEGDIINSVIDWSKKTIAPYVRMIRDGEYKIKRFVAQPGFAFQNTKVRLKLECFDTCNGVSIDTDGDGELDTTIESNTDEIELFKEFTEVGVFTLKACTDLDSLCFETPVIVNPLSPVEQVFSKNVVVYWPKDAEFFRPYVNHIIDYIQRSIDVGYFDYWGVNRDWLPEILPIVLVPNFSFGKEMCLVDDSTGEECENDDSVVASVYGTPLWNAFGAQSGEFGKIDTIIHELAHAYDYTANLSRTAELDYEIVPIWRHEGYAVTFSGNIGYGTTFSSKHYTAYQVIRSGTYAENFIELAPEEVRGSCGGTATVCYVQSTSLCGVMFPAFWNMLSQEDIISYWSKLSYLDHDQALQAALGMTNEEYWNYFKEWALLNVPEFIEPNIETIDPQTLRFRLQGEGEYYILIYKNGAPYPIGRKYINGNEEFSLIDYYDFNATSLRLFIRQADRSQNPIPLLSKDGKEYVILLKDKASLLFVTTNRDGSSVIDTPIWNEEQYYSDQPNKVIAQTIKSQTIIPEMIVTRDQVCFDFSPYIGYTEVTTLEGDIWYDDLKIDVVSEDYNENQYFCYSSEKHGRYAGFKEKHLFIEDYYNTTPMKLQVAIKIPEVIDLSMYKNIAMSLGLRAANEDNILKVYVSCNERSHVDNVRYYFNIQVGDITYWMASLTAFNTNKTPIYVGPSVGFGEIPILQIPVNAIPEGEYTMNFIVEDNDFNVIDKKSIKIIKDANGVYVN